MVEEKKENPPAPAVEVHYPGVSAADFASALKRVGDLEKAMELMAPRLVELEGFVKGAAKVAADLLPPGARDSFLKNWI